MNEHAVTFRGVVIRTAVVHTITYFIVGLLAYTLFDYTTQFAEAGVQSYMRPTSDPLVMAGPLFQPIRGVLFGVVFYLLREVLFGRRNGWLVMWTMLVVVGILSTFGPAPGSIEGLVYTKVWMPGGWGGMAEVLIQTLLLSVITTWWVNHPEKRWVSWVLGIAVFFVLLFPVLGLLVTHTGGGA